ncbi:zinc ion binding / nucleic acid binding protein [Trifolium repens]|nr:zinc ion binding / nucleic acid binding protein [Trifolium repens]
MAGNDMNPLLGFIEKGRQLSTEEADQVERSEKKVKIGEGRFTGESTVPISYADIYVADGGVVEKEAARPSYKQSLTGLDEGMQHDTGHASMEADGEDDDYAGLSVVEKMVGQYECPQFILSEKEEKRIQKPWRQGLIVKLMGRRIGYKALETRLKQIWVRKGVITIIDLGGEYFLVYFTDEEDYNHALEDGPWMIYDHYLIAREWSPNFHPSDATIEKAAVWVRIPDLPIEYYDAKVLHYIGDRISETVKVDRNTLFQERGKYARVCVEVDLNKPLLAMFELKGKIYKVEYEGLHMLCRFCGKFGHYVEGCPEKKTPSNNARSTTDVEQVTENMADDTTGPWVVVQKPRRPRRAKDNNNRDGPTVANGRSTGTGTRFEILEQLNEDPETAVTDNDEPIIAVPAVTNHQHSVHDKGGERTSKHVGTKKGKAAVNMGENSQRIEKHGTHTVLKQLPQRETNKGALTRSKTQGNHEITNNVPYDYAGNDKQTPQKTNEETIHNTLSHEGPHHMPRPPDQHHMDHNQYNKASGTPLDVDESLEPKTSYESMEFVQETPNLTQQEGDNKHMELA